MYLYGAKNQGHDAPKWRQSGGCRMERIFRVQTVKLVGPGLSSTSPERRRKARRKKLRQCRVRGRVMSKKKGDGVRVK